ncbi:hypothetical protein RGUI_3126 [Rhodovulum sp. P5]|nr:hypothetical protein RGUI_3126 [Rhodovulum sp. P5]
MRTPLREGQCAKHGQPRTVAVGQAGQNRGGHGDRIKCSPYVLNDAFLMAGDENLLP